MLTYRWLEPSDEDYLDQIDRTIEELNWARLPSRRTFGMSHRIMGVFDGVVLVGWHVVQFFTHAEPIWLHPAYHGTRAAMQLTEKVVDYLVTSETRGFMIVAESPVVARMAEHYGLQKVGVPVYVWLG